jgi:hypothetical protein
MCGGIFDPAYCRRTLKEELLMSLRDKTIRHEKNSEQLAWEAGKTASKFDLEMYLTAYLGDDFFARQFTDCIDMIRKKNADYSQGEQKGDRIAAFRRIAKDVNITMEQAWAVFCQKHWGAVMKYVKEGTVESEAIEGRIHDVINYMVLLAAIIDDRKKSADEDA